MIISENAINRIISKSNYWNELRKRENGGTAQLKLEFMEEFNLLGGSEVILYILEDYAKTCKQNKEKKEEKEDAGQTKD